VDTTANLRGITSFGSRLVVVGDEVVLVQLADGTWAEQLPPEGSWGQLRAVYNHGSRLYAVGLGGVIWSAEDPNGEWLAEPSGVEVDLFDVGPLGEIVGVVGAEGTLLVGGECGWTRVETGLSRDLINHEHYGVLAADGEVFEVGENYELRPIDRIPGALALSYHGFNFYDDLVVVGEGGEAALTSWYECPTWPRERVVGAGPC
jgi:photosystem II stability/assembly factor-like uncharacterized protein